MIDLTSPDSHHRPDRRGQPDLTNAALTQRPTICVVDDHGDNVTGMSRLLARHYRSSGVVVEGLCQRTESARTIAEWVLDQHAAVLITDHNMLEDTLGADVIAEAARLDPEACSKMTFIVCSAKEDEARERLQIHSATIGEEFVSRIFVLGKGVLTEEIFRILDSKFP